MNHFGLKNLDDLPNASELRRIALPKAKPPEEAASQHQPAAEQQPAEPPASEPELFDPQPSESETFEPPQLEPEPAEVAAPQDSIPREESQP
jgi:hypothetical protein